MVAAKRKKTAAGSWAVAPKPLPATDDTGKSSGKSSGKSADAKRPRAASQPGTTTTTTTTTTSSSDKLAAVGFNASYRDASLVSAMGDAFKSFATASLPLTAHSSSSKPSSRPGRTYTDATVHARPFRSVVLPDVLDPSFLSSLRKTLLANEAFYHKSNDLYEFFQSNDLKRSTSKELVQLREAIYSPAFVSFMQSITGLALTETVDLSAHRYPQNGYLLCHDDDIGSEDDGRRIAFIIYLVEEDWAAADGGLLQLFDCDDKGRPNNIVKSIVPQWNTMAFFEVLPTSHHEVQQVFCARERVSISGWFHGPKPSIPRGILSLAGHGNSNDNGDDDDDIDPAALLAHPALTKWINPVYLSPRSIAAIQSKMAQESTIELHSFLKPAVYTALQSAMDQAQFTRILGPANARRFRVLGRHIPHDHEPAPAYLHMLDDVKGFMSGPAFAAFLRLLTGMDLKPQPASSILRQFGVGDYTLVHDHVVEPPGLDVVFSCPGVVDGSADAADMPWDDGTAGDGEQDGGDGSEDEDDDSGVVTTPKRTGWGGGLHYISGEDTLLSSYPTDNSLLLVCRDKGTMRFVKLVTAKSLRTRREVSLVFEEVAGSDGEDGEDGDAANEEDANEED